MKRLLAKFIDHIICFFASFITGVRPQQLTENSVPTVYYANHHSHGDFILVWISLPQHLRLKTRPVAGRIIGRKELFAVLLRMLFLMYCW